MMKILGVFSLFFFASVGQADVVSLTDGGKITLGSTTVTCNVNNTDSGTHCACRQDIVGQWTNVLYLLRTSDNSFLSRLGTFEDSSTCYEALAKHPSCR